MEMLMSVFFCSVSLSHPILNIFFFAFLCKQSSVVSGLEELDSTASEITESEEEEQANRLLSIDEMMEVIQPQVENATRSIASTFPSKEVVVKNHETQRLNVSSSVIADFKLEWRFFFSRRDSSLGQYFLFYIKCVTKYFIFNHFIGPV